MPKVINTDRLFETIVELFSKQGYAGTTTQDIARAAGVNEVTLFRRYGTKAALIAAALGHVLRRTPMAGLSASEDVRADLVAIVKGYSDTYGRYGEAVMTLLFEASQAPELRPAVEALLPNLQSVAAIVAHHQSRGQLAPGNPMAIIVALLAPIMVTGLWRRTGVPVPISEPQPHEAVENFLRGRLHSPRR